MNACSNRRVSERPVLNTQHAAPRVSDVSFAAGVARLFRVRGSRKIRSFAAKERSPLFLFGFFGRNPAKSELPKFFAGFIASRISAKIKRMLRVTFVHVFSRAKAFEIFKPIIRLVPVNVVDMFASIKTDHPTFGNKSMDKVFARKQIPRRMFTGRVRAMLSKDFPATRNGVKMVKHTVFNAVHRKANHVVPSRLVTGIIF